MYFQLLAVRFLLVCLLISFASLSTLFLSERRREVSDGRIKISIKDEKPFGFICIHACLWLLLSTTSAHTWSWVLLCVCLFAQVCVWNYMNIKSVIAERRKARSDPVMMMMISMWVCVWVVWSGVTSESYPQSICAHFPPTLRHPGTEMNVHITGISRSEEALAAERERSTNKKYLTREG